MLGRHCAKQLVLIKKTCFTLPNYAYSVLIFQFWLEYRLKVLFKAEIVAHPHYRCIVYKYIIQSIEHCIPLKVLLHLSHSKVYIAWVELVMTVKAISNLNLDTNFFLYIFVFFPSYLSVCISIFVLFDSQTVYLFICPSY